MAIIGVSVLAGKALSKPKGVVSNRKDSLAKVDYRGQYTNIPAGMERAIYELKSSARKDAAKVVVFMTDGDVAGAISTAWPDSGADIMFGIGGTPEGVIAAAALKCMGGEIQGKLWPRNDEERNAALEAGYDLDQVLTTDVLVAGDNCFFSATGITDGELMKGVHYSKLGATTQSLVMRSKSGTVRVVEAHHAPDKFI